MKQPLKIPILSVNVALPQMLSFRGIQAATAIFKRPVAGRVGVHRLGLEGDGQADLSVHGGPEKAVYAYAADHYELWQMELGREFERGTFGENLTLGGGLEHGIRVGDVYRAGTSVLRVTKPRTPCYKLALKLGREDIIERFLASGRSGFYLAVLQEGELRAGDGLQLMARDENRPTIADVNRYYQNKLRQAHY